MLRTLTAGAAGTTALNATTYLDMLVTGRPASSAPGDAVLALADEVGVSLPGGEGREEAYGALAGIGVGLAGAVAARTLHPVLKHLPAAVETVAVGGLAMALTDVPLHVLGVTDVHAWSAADWTRDAVPHVVYGATVVAALRAADRAADRATREAGAPRRSRLSTVLRGVTIGAATGARSTLGLLPLALRVPHGLTVAGALVATELTVDKLPATPSRLEPGPYAARVALGSLGAVVATHGDGRGALLPALAGAAGAIGGAAVGAAFRDVCAERGWRLGGALTEDALALAAAALVSRVP